MINEIDFSLDYRIEAIPDKSQPEMFAKGISVYPGTSQIIYAKFDNTLQRFVNTGLDEYDPKVLNLKTEERERVVKQILEKRKELEDKIGQPGFLSPTSDGWTSDLTAVNISVGEDLKVRVNGHTNVLCPSKSYKDAIALLILFSDDKFPKSKDDVGNPSYKGAKFYLTTDGELNKMSKEVKQKRRRASVFLDEMFNEKEPQAEKAWNVAFYLGLTNKQEVDIDTLDDVLEKAVTGDTTGKTRDKFIEACEMDNGKLLVYNMFQKAINTGLIRVSTDGFYFLGSTNYRKTKEDSVEYLMKAGNELLLAELRGETIKKTKGRKAVA